MTRAFFIFLSHQRTLRRWFETSRIANRLTRRFVAGHTLEDEIAACRRLYQEHILATIDRLGENVTSLDEAAASRDAYLEVLERIHQSGLPATVSIKLTQFGLDFSTEACFQNVRRLVCRAKDIGTRIEIDMESSEYVDRTLDIVCRLHREIGNVRAVVQSYLRRTREDVVRLCELSVPVRLVKGAYDEPHTVAFAAKSEVDASYADLTKLLLDRNPDPAIATHDEALIEVALRHARERGIAPDRFEFQMLYGIRRDLQAKLVSQGCRVRLYVPYGDAWYPYFMRRLAERPANVFFLMRNLLRK
jgi:proline dehydrogenase